MAFLYFAESHAANAFPAKFVFRNNIFGRGANLNFPRHRNSEFQSLKFGRDGRQAKAAALLALALQMISAKVSPVPDREVFRVLTLPRGEIIDFENLIKAEAHAENAPPREITHIELLYSAETPNKSAKPNLNIVIL